MSLSSSARAATDVLRAGRQTSDQTFPVFGRWPHLDRVGIDGQFQERDRHVREASARVISRRKFLSSIKSWHEEAGLFDPTSQVTVTFRVDGDRVDALVVWSVWGMGRPRVLRRVSGPLPLSGRTLRRLGPVVALHRLLKALGESTDL